MKLSNRYCVIFTAFAICLLLGRAAFAEVHATDEFQDGSTRPVTLAVLPSQVEFVTQRLIRQEAQVDESGELESVLTAAVASELAARGYDLQIVDSDLVGGDASLREMVVDANRRFGELRTNLEARLSKTRQIQRRRYNAGDEAKLLAARLGTDAIAFIRMQIIVPAAGVRALNFGLGGATSFLSVSIIDGTTGDLEAYITLPAMRRGSLLGGHDEILDNPIEEMGKYASATLEDIPQAEPSLRAQRSDEDVISDLEALLDE